MSELISNKVWKQIGQDINGEEEYDCSGESVSLSSNGEIVAIGSRSNRNNTGHVRVFKNVSNIWTQIGQDIDGEAIGDSSGYSVSLSANGNIVAIGAPYNGNSSGHVRVYEYVNKKWTQLGKDIDGEANEDLSGYSVSLSSDGKTVAIGSPISESYSSKKDYVKIYHYVNNNWTKLGNWLNLGNWINFNWPKLGNKIYGEAKEDYSGWSVSLSSNGKIVAIGAPENDDNGESSGHVRVYQYVNKEWKQMGKDIDGEAPFDSSGYSVSINAEGNIVAIGAPNNNLKSGHVRVYKYINKEWEQIGEDIDGEGSGDNFGKSVSLSDDGNIVAIGAPYYKNFTGRVKIYQYYNKKWIQIGLDINGENVYDISGYSVSLSSDGKAVAIGAIFNDGNGKNSGHVRVYKLETEQNERKIRKNQNLENDYTSLTNLGLLAAGIYAIRKILK